MPDPATVETALVVIAVSLAAQTLLFAGGAVAVWLGYRRALVAITDEVRELRATTDDMARTLQRAADAVGRGSDAVGSAVSDARNAAHTVGALTSTVASVITTPRTAAAMGVLRGVQWWRRRRQEQRGEPADVTPRGGPPRG